jgi:hypothetical protein
MYWIGEQRGTGFEVNVVTTAASSSSAGDEVFLSRMFAPSCGVPEGLFSLVSTSIRPPNPQTTIW